MELGRDLQDEDGGGGGWLLEGILEKESFLEQKTLAILERGGDSSEEEVGNGGEGGAGRGLGGEGGGRRGWRVRHDS